MSTHIPADGGTELLAGAFRTIGERLEDLYQRNEQAKIDMENGGWGGLEEIQDAIAELQKTQDQLEQVADTVGLQGQIIADAREAAAHAGNRDTIVNS